MKDFKPQSTIGSVWHHLLLSAFSFIVGLLLSSGTADAQSAGSQTAKLIGTIKSDGFIGAVLSDAKGEQIFYRLKEKLPDGSQIVGVHSDSISLKGADGTRYEMYIAHDTNAAKSTVAPANSAANPAVTVNPNTPGSIRNSPTERPPSYLEKRRGKRKSDLDNE